MAASDVDPNEIAEKALDSPKSVTVDGNTVTARTADEIRKLGGQVASNRALARKGFGLKQMKLRSQGGPGSVERT
jgi:hypothetical protein